MPIKKEDRYIIDTSIFEKLEKINEYSEIIQAINMKLYSGERHFVLM